MDEKTSIGILVKFWYLILYFCVSVCNAKCLNYSHLSKNDIDGSAVNHKATNDIDGSAVNNKVKKN